jgi:hypothetical protein
VGSVRYVASLGLSAALLAAGQIGVGTDPAAATSQPAITSPYTLVDLGPGQSNSGLGFSPVAVSDNGEVIGNYGVANTGGSGTTSYAEVWKHGVFTQLPGQSGANGTPALVAGINSAGTIIGNPHPQTSPAEVLAWQATTADPTTITDPSGGSIAGVGIDTQGDVSFSTAEGPALGHATGGPLTVVPGDNGYVNGVGGGVYAATSYTNSDTFFGPISSPQTTTPLDFSPRAVASDGSILGETSGGLSTYQPVLRLPNGTETTIAPGGWIGEGVNASHQVIIETNNSQPQLVQNATMTAVSSLLPSTWTYPIMAASPIDDDGDLLGYAQLNGVTENFLLQTTRATPVPPVVNSTGDAPSSDPTGADCDTGSTVASSSNTQVPECTLRAAIQSVNTADNGEQITFNISPSSGSLEIAPATALPPITATGTTVNFGSESTPIELNPSTTGAGLEVKATGVTINGLYAHGWAQAILLDAPGHDIVTDSKLGTSPVNATGNTAAIEIRDSPDNVIGGTGASDGNVISGDSIGVYIDGTGSTGNRVEGNIIGSDAAGTASQPDGVGVLIRDASDNTVGGVSTTAGEAPGNQLVGGQGGSGGSIFIVGISAKATDNTVAGNLIGLDGTGTKSLATSCQAEVAIVGSSQGTTIGGSATGAGNVISGQCATQVSVSSTVTSGTKILGNLIGTDRSGDQQVDVGQATYGIDVDGAQHTTVGQPGEANIVVGFDRAIVGKPTSRKTTLSYPTPVAVPGSNATLKGSTDTTIEGNDVGTPNGKTVQTVGGLSGILLTGKGDVVRRDVVGGFEYGVELQDATGAETVDANKIGVNAAGTRDLDNIVDVLVTKSKAAVIGQTGLANVIGGHGIGVDIESSPDVAVRDNRIGVTQTGDAALAAYSGSLPDGFEKAFTAIDSSRAGISTDKNSPKATIEDNTISALPKDGITIRLSKATRISGNNIGVGHNGKAKLGNGGSGIVLAGTAEPLIGSKLKGHRATGDGNLIAYNKNDGIQLIAVQRPYLLSNLIWGNNGNGLHISSSTGVLDAPVILSAANISGLTIVRAEIHSDRPQLVQLFEASSCGAHPDVKTLLGSDYVADPDGNVRPRFSVKIVPVGTHIVLTRTESLFGTSDYSTCRTVEATK